MIFFTPCSMRSMVHGVKKKTILLIFEYAQVLCILFMNIKITDRFSDVIAALVKYKTSAAITSLRWSVSYFFVSIARANFICRYSRTSRYISFTWGSKRGHLRCANGALAPPCPPYDTPKKHSMNLQASRVLKIGNLPIYPIRMIGPTPLWCIFFFDIATGDQKTMLYICT